MSLQFCDGFDSYTTTAQVANRWSNAPSGNISAVGGSGGRFSGGSLTPNNISLVASKFFNSGSIATGAKLRMGFWIKPSGSSGTQTAVATAGNQGGSTDKFLFFSGTGAIQVCRIGTVGGTVLLTSSGTYLDGQYHWVEVEILLATGATGSVALYVDGVSQGSVSSVQTLASSAYAPVNYVGLWGIFLSGGSAVPYDDLIVWDDQGSNFNTFPLGPRRIGTLTPTGDSTPLNFTPDTGTTHYTQVSGGWGGTHYVQDGGTGNADMYTYASLGWSPSTINAVVATQWAQNPGTATANITAKVSDGTNTVTGASSTMGSGGVNGCYTTMFYTNPAGGAWAASGVNSMRLGVGD